MLKLWIELKKQKSRYENEKIKADSNDEKSIDENGKSTSK